jgi:hypothetical protein
MFSGLLQLLMAQNYNCGREVWRGWKSKFGQSWGTTKRDLKNRMRPKYSRDRNIRNLWRHLRSLMVDCICGRLLARLTPAVVRITNDCLDTANIVLRSSMTSRDQTMYTEYSLTILSHTVPAKFPRTSREVFWSLLSSHINHYSPFFSSVAHVWVPDAKTTGPIVKKFGFS